MENTSKTLSTGMQRKSFYFQLSHLKAHAEVAVGTLLNQIYVTSSFVVMNKSDSSYVLSASLQLHYCRSV